MSAIHYEDIKELDREWVRLMAHAKDLGYTTDEVRNILAVMQEGMLEEVSGKYA